MDINTKAAYTYTAVMQSMSVAVGSRNIYPMHSYGSVDIYSLMLLSFALVRIH